MADPEKYDDCQFEAKLDGPAPRPEHQTPKSTVQPIEAMAYRLEIEDGEAPPYDPLLHENEGDPD